MAIANPGPPPNGYYWFRPGAQAMHILDPGRTEEIVQFDNGKFYFCGREPGYEFALYDGEFVPCPLCDEFQELSRLIQNLKKELIDLARRLGVPDV